MTDQDFAFEAKPEAAVGTHPCIVKSVEAIELDTREGLKPLIRWTVIVTDEDGEDAEVDALSSRNNSSRSKSSKWLAALGVKPEPGKPVNPADLAGLTCLAVIGQDDDGFSTLDDLIAAPKTKAK